MKKKIAVLLSPLILFVLIQCDTVNPYTYSQPDEEQLLEASKFLLWYNSDFSVSEQNEAEVKNAANMFRQIRQRYGLRDARLSETFALPWNPRTILVQLNIADLHHFNATGEYPWNEESGVPLPERTQKFNVGVEFFALSYNFDFNPHQLCGAFITVEGVARCDASYGVFQADTIAPLIVERKGEDHLIFWFTGRQKQSENLARVEVENGIYRFSQVKANQAFSMQLNNDFRLWGQSVSPREL
ncbi:MAG: hypothetical protein LAT75_13580 [Candidatus Cyclonatronum sp.]|uniref:hypothetical protein n=1 Tax=Cyclonatronum sp. TaxID=3024185 RepID=UPI0025C621F9|nr:hypothetical protein [Cyclonatronum sp.]MCH8487892.1 hypothetical protein [Cyclonatronum sp.]